MARLLVVLLLLVVTARPALAADHPKSLIVLSSIRIAAAVFDAWSTTRALANHPDAREANPILRPFAANPATLYAVMVSLAALQVWIADKRFHRGESWQWIPIAGATASGVVAVVNLRFD
jgi:hypothetical protein